MSFSFLFLWTLYSSFHGQASTVAFGIIDPVKTTKTDFSGISEEERLKIRNEIMRAEWEKDNK